MSKSDFSTKGVSSLCWKEVELNIPENFKELILRDAIKGPQPDNTIIVVSIFY